MLYSIKDREGLEKLEELTSLQNQLKGVRLQDKLVERIFHENIKKEFEPVTDTIEKISENLTNLLEKLLIITTKL